MKNPFIRDASPSRHPSSVGHSEPQGNKFGCVGCDPHDADSQALLTYLQNSMARDLHDSFPQEFQAVIMHLRVALETKSSKDATHHVQQAIAAAQTGLTCVRGLIKDLRHGSQVEQSQHATSRVIDIVSQAAQSALTTHLVGFTLTNTIADVGVSRNVGLHVAMIVREAIHNAVKHGAPSNIACRLVAQRKAVMIELRDDGIGLKKSTGVAGFGLIGMQERALAIGASIKIFSDQQKGCAVQLTLPNRLLIDLLPQPVSYLPPVLSYTQATSPPPVAAGALRLQNAHKTSTCDSAKHTQSGGRACETPEDIGYCITS